MGILRPLNCFGHEGRLAGATLAPDAQRSAVGALEVLADLAEDVGAADEEAETLFGEPVMGQAFVIERIVGMDVHDLVPGWGNLTWLFDLLQNDTG